LGFGYRAKYLARTAVIVAEEKPPGWLDNLSNNPDIKLDDEDFKDFQQGGRASYRKAHEELLQLQGVGPKVADCVCLMGLGWGEAVPVDTHVWQIAQKDYNFGRGKHKSLTKATYDAVSDHFRSLWGMEAGWAHSVLFEDGIDLQESIIAKRQFVVEDMIKDEKEENVIKEKRRRVKPLN
jgi:N-glycosylase/DNA lyase